MHIDTLQSYADFKQRFERPPNIRTARKKVKSGAWPGRVDDDGDVWIYSIRFDLNQPAPDSSDQLALQLLGN